MRVYRRPKIEPPDYVINEDGCWLWTGGVNNRGYGSLKVNGKHMHSHRAMWEQERGPIPGNLTIDHICKIKLCVNPDHMRLMTRLDNQRLGSHVKITYEQAEQIRADPRMQKEIAVSYGLSESQVSRIRSGKMWVIPPAVEI